MKGTTQLNLLAAVVLAAGAAVPIALGQSEALSQEMFARMDSNQDGKVSRKEYIDYGTAYLKKKGRRVNRTQMESKFVGFDRNGDGFITGEDPECRSPKELLDERIVGTWSAESGDKTMSFVFMPDNQADVIKNEESMREKARGKMTYKFVHLSRTPTCLDIVVDRGSDSDCCIKCIIEFLSEDRMKLKMMAGSGFVVRPRGFSDGLDPDVIVLTRTQRPEQVAMVSAQHPAPRATQSARPVPQEHKGVITAKLKVEKTSDKRVESSERERPAGTMVTTTTKRIEEEVQSVSVAVANSGPERDTFELCWYFLCRPADGGAVRIYDKGKKSFVLDPRKRASHSVTAKKICKVEQTVMKENEDTGFCSDPIDSIWGDKAEGYLVMLKHGDTILDKKSSSKEFLTDQWLSRL